MLDIPSTAMSSSMLSASTVGKHLSISYAFGIHETDKMDDALTLEQLEPVFRAYRGSDRNRCVALAVEAWPQMSSAMPDSVETDFWGMLVDLARDYSDWHEVACTTDSVVGFLFGRRCGSPSTRETVGFARTFLSAMYKIARKSSARQVIPIFCSCMLTELKIQFKNPGHDGEVAFLVVDGRHRGKGIGKCLLKRFVEFAREKDVKAISVYTTDPGCNWRFYETQGFKKVVEFDDDIGTYLEGSPSRGLILSLDLRARV